MIWRRLARRVGSSQTDRSEPGDDCGQAKPRSGSVSNALVVLLLGMTVSWLSGGRAFTQNAGAIDPQLPPYARPEQPVVGPLQIVSTVATAALVAQWTVALRDLLPELDIQTTSLETAMMPPWWTIGGPHTVAVLAQSMTDEENVAFVQQFGYRPTRLRVARDAVAVIVHRSNPVVQRGLTLPELDAMFSTTRVRGHPDLKRWGDLGLGGGWAERPLTLYGQDAAAGLYVYFRRRVLNDGDFKATVARLPSSAAVVTAVGSDINAVGYAGINAVTAGVSTVPLANAPGQSAVAPRLDTVQQQRYPLVYVVSLYLNQAPGSRVEGPLRELLYFIYSRQGQRLMAEASFVPLSAAGADAALQHAGLSLTRQRRE